MPEILERESFEHRVNFNRATISLQESSTHGDANQIQSLPELVEYNARHNADYPFCVQARTVKHGDFGSSGGFQTITISHGQLRNSIRHCSWYLSETVKELELPARSNDGMIRKGAPVALFVESDVGLLIYKLSLMSLGVPVSFIYLSDHTFLNPILSGFGEIWSFSNTGKFQIISGCWYKEKAKLNTKLGAFIICSSVTYRTSPFGV